MQATFNVFNDPGHGWVKAPFSLLIELEIATKITTYSYVRGSYVYLEEDQDATTLINALKEHGIQAKFHDYYSDKQSKIRNYSPYPKLGS